MKIGILGGGQLGRMFLQVASNGPDEIHILDPDPAAPAAALTPHFHRGDRAGLRPAAGRHRH